ncbi:MAG: DNA modification methylase [Myxococcota bacterium]|jgi:DNA modification methylase
MQTTHTLHFADARKHLLAPPQSAALVVTSPPYPMIAMWDQAFGAMSPTAKRALKAGNGGRAFEAMHRQLDAVWRGCFEALIPGGFLCINIGDATRTLAGQFGLYANHARVSTALSKVGFTTLPDILWRKPTNAPNKFMGSGMLPGGAYVTYEHEYILIARKGGKRVFSTKSRALRRRSAYFWEERNRWFSDLWTGMRGTNQALSRADRDRSGAYPLTLPYRLICMYSLYGETVIDPFAGTGTTLAAAIATGRNSIGIERDASMAPSIEASLAAAVAVGKQRAADRLVAHRAFVSARLEAGKTLTHHNAAHDVPVITAQEKLLELRAPVSLVRQADAWRWTAEHAVI